MSERKYRIHPQFIIIPHGNDKVEFRSGIWNPTSIFIQDHEQQGKLYSVVKNINGRHTTSEIGKLIQVPTSQVEEVVDQLLQMQIAQCLESDPLNDFLTQYMPIFSSGEKVEHQKPILLIGDRNITEPLFSQLSAVFPKNMVTILSQEDLLYHELYQLKAEDWLYDGISFLEKVEQYKTWKDCFIVLAFSNINPNMAKNFNRIANELNISWIQIALDGPFILIGPAFLGGEPPCYECLESRIGMNLRENGHYQKYKIAIAEKTIEQQDAQVNPLIISLLTSHASIEIANIILTGVSFTTRKLLAIYLPTMEIAFNELFPLSSCQVCGCVPHQSDEQLYFDMQTQLRERE